jgi:hypothetical protein
MSLREQEHGGNDEAGHDQAGVATRSAAAHGA